MSDAIADELTGIDLGDQRLNERGKRILTDLAAKPEVSINAALPCCAFPAGRCPPPGFGTSSPPARGPDKSGRTY